MHASQPSSPGQHFLESAYQPSPRQALRALPNGPCTDSSHVAHQLQRYRELNTDPPIQGRLRGCASVEAVGGVNMDGPCFVNTQLFITCMQTQAAQAQTMCSPGDVIP